VINNAEAEARLSSIADMIVTHDREIVMPCDDSVVRVINSAPTFLRRARGFTPEPITLPHAVPCGVGLGGHLKTTICVTHGREAFLSQHIGDLDDPATNRFYWKTLAHMIDILDIQPEFVACDLHPDFYSSQQAQAMGLPVKQVQHHHAHIAACAAEHGVSGRRLGLALDGYGLGTDGSSSWGGEFLVVEGPQCERVGRLAPLKQPGGDAAARAPWRMGAAALYSLQLCDMISERYKDYPECEMLTAMLERDVNSPESSSCGRLFDAACGLLGVKPTTEFDGEGPMALEAFAVSVNTMADGWVLSEEGTLSFLPLLEALLDMTPQIGAGLFHGTLAEGLADACEAQIARHDLPREVLAGGGCFQNRVLTRRLDEALAARTIRLIRPVRAPANDGGLSLGQVWVGALANQEKG